MNAKSFLTRSIADSAALTGRRQKPSVIGSFGRRLLLARLAHLAVGQLTIRENGQTLVFGTGSGDETLHATIDVLDGRFWGDIAFGGSVGAGEAYIRGYWNVDNLTRLMRLMVRNRAVLDSLEGGLAILSSPVRKLLHFANRNTQRGSERNIAAHYDLGNDFFELMLDRTMAYSCGIYATPSSTLESASIAKFDSICTKLRLQPSDHLVEIGTGWGGLAIHAARDYGCRVTSTTISGEQYEYAKAAVAAAGLTDKITLLRQDYRSLTGQYDKLVSVEMVEAVGHEFLAGYFGSCSRLLKPDGVMLLQAITIQDQFYETARKTVDFIQRYVFPGSFIPSITVLINAATQGSDLKLSHLEDIGPHYATTLNDWRVRLINNEEKIRALGFSDEFLRLFEFYLCYCEGGFAERQLGDVHMLLTKPLARNEPLITGKEPALATA